MPRKGITLILIIVLSISLIIISLKCRSISEERSWNQTNANMNVKADLSVASGLFGGNSLTEGNGRNFNYNQAMSMIASASQLFGFTTYNENNNDLIIILDNLCVVMENDKYKESVIQKSNSIYKVLLQLSRNPEDKNATNNLSNLIEEIRQDK